MSRPHPLYWAQRPIGLAGGEAAANRSAWRRGFADGGWRAKAGTAQSVRSRRGERSGEAEPPAGSGFWRICSAFLAFLKSFFCFRTFCLTSRFSTAFSLTFCVPTTCIPILS